MTLLTMRDLENSLKLNQLLNQSTNLIQHNNNTEPTNNPNLNNFTAQSNVNFILQNASVTKANVFTNAMLHQLQLQNQAICNNKNLITNCLGSSSFPSASSSETGQKGQINSGRYKTELCRQFIENGGCKYGDKCQFAHGMPDLKDVNRHPKYKTDYCKTFHSKGFCPYGPRCHFIHELNEKVDGNSSKKSKCPEVVRHGEDSKLDKQLEALHTRLSSNLLMTDDVFEKHSKFSHGMKSNHLSDADNKSMHQLDDLNSSFLSSSSPPLSPMPQPRTRSGTSSTSSLISSSSSYDLNQIDRVYSPVKSNTSQPLMRQTYNIPMSKNLIQIGRNLIHEKLTNPGQDQATLNQQIANIERLNNLLNSNQFNFYQNPQQNATW